MNLCCFEPISHGDLLLQPQEAKMGRKPQEAGELSGSSLAFPRREGRLEGWEETVSRKFWQANDRPLSPSCLTEEP